MNDCIFCKIIAKDIPAKLMYENDACIVIEDIAPKAPVHYLIIPKKHIENVAQLTPKDGDVAANLLFTAQAVGKTLANPNNFRLLMNTGKDVGQSVFHMHAHLLAGKKMSDF